MYCAQTYRQTTDALHATTLMVERRLDMHSQSCLGEADLEKFYDSVDLVDIAEFLCNFPAADAALITPAIPVQILPTGVLRLMGVMVFVTEFVVGALTCKILAGI